MALRPVLETIVVGVQFCPLDLADIEARGKA